MKPAAVMLYLASISRSCSATSIPPQVPSSMCFFISIKSRPDPVPRSKQFSLSCGAANLANIEMSDWWS
ncbi:hypothetical protein I7I50_04612 [Histoplasma capsulatum G186AR]|uniref:Secreted protein n=1 Tax=Ajellomyces capsulatus TaxID=5037 RepID=A0A8H8CZ47_AJECA|nr:hypothetical protein I7I52_05521 [Histoplasma capsulatum]QSS75470.1 hypothetical protein I7I50_04612 [Histoplasma capsulatum G186AR]